MGRYGHPSQRRALLLAFVALAASAPGQSVLIAAFVDEMLAGTQLSRTAFATVFGLATVVASCTIVALGDIVDRFGLRRLWLLAALLLTVACATASVATGFVLTFLALALLRVSGQGSFPLIATLLVGRNFDGRRGQAMAVASLGVTVGATLLPPVVVLSILWIGWRATFVVLGLAGAMLLLPLTGLVKPDVRRSGGDRPSTRTRGRFSGLRPPAGRAAQLVRILAVPSLVVTGIVFHAVSLLGQRGFSFEAVGFALSVLGLSHALGTVLAGAVADRISTRALLVGMNGTLTVGAAAMLFPSAPAAWFSFVLLGVAGGTFSVAIGVVWPRAFGLEEMGRLQGFSLAAQITASALAPLPAALAVAATGSYVVALTALALIAGLALVDAARWRDPALPPAQLLLS